jgi:hypothetical protein
MDDMPEPRHAADMRRLTSGQWALSVSAAILMLGLAGLAFRGMFSSVSVEMVPFFGRLSWIVPIGVDLGIVILILVGILLEWLAMPMPGLRLVAAFFMGCTMWLNAVAAHGSPAGIIGHLSLPVLFIACVEAVRHAVRRRSGLAAGLVREGVPLARWALAPVPTFLLWRRMVLWQETSYIRALDREQLRRRTLASLRAAYGGDWRRKADQSVVWQLSRGIDVEGAAATTRKALPAPAMAPVAATPPALPPAPAPDAPAVPVPAAPPGGTRKATVTAIQRVRRMGIRKAADEDIRAAIREMVATGTPVTKYRVVKELKGPKGGISDERAGRLLTEVQSERPSLHLAGKAAVGD